MSRLPLPRVRFPGGLQTRLIAAFVAVTLVALAAASTVFVYLRRDDQEQRALDRVAAASPSIASDVSASLAARASLADAVTSAAERYGVRVLLVERASGRVLADSDKHLAGQTLDGVVDADNDDERHLPGDDHHPYESWSPPRGDPGAGYTYVTARSPRQVGGERGPGPGGGPANNPASPASYDVVLGVKESTLSGAWLDLLPWLGAAGGAALVVAVALAVLLARSIARPVARLTVASQQVAAGRFEVDIDTDRSDELGQLGSAFASMARRIGRTQSEMRALVADVSHDLKTPLTSILGFSTALQAGAASSPEEAEHFGSIIHEEAERLSHRLADLLLLSELEGGQAVLQRAPIDLGDLVRAVATRRLAPAAAGGVHTDLSGIHSAVIDGDATKLERVFENLLANAAKFTPSGGRVAVAVTGDARGGATATVRNTAPGLTPDELPLLFRRFYRRDRTRTGGAGSGLGLPIAADLVALHGGDLSATLDGGELVMTVRLPATPPP